MPDSNINIKYSIVLLISILSISFCISQSTENISFKLCLAKNRSPKAVADSISSLTSNKPSYILALDYVSTNYKHFIPYGQNDQVQKSLVHAILTKYGYCWDKALVLASLLDYMGFKTRICQLGGHTITELKTDTTLVYLDPDYHSWFIRGGNKDCISLSDIVCNSNELEINLLKISPRTLLNFDLDKTRDIPLTLKNATGKIPSAILSFENNHLDKFANELSHIKLCSFAFVPMGSQVTYYQVNNPIINKVLEIKIPPKSIGSIKIPLPLLYLRASERHLDSPYRDSDYLITASNPDFNISEFNLKSLTDTVYLYFSANGLVFPQINTLNDPYIKLPNKLELATKFACYFFDYNLPSEEIQSFFTIRDSLNNLLTQTSHNPDTLFKKIYSLSNPIITETKLLQNRIWLAVTFVSEHNVQNTNRIASYLSVYIMLANNGLLEGMEFYLLLDRNLT